MAARHWGCAIAFLLLVGVTKAGMLFFRLVVLAAAGLGGLFLLHVLAMDYSKIQAARPKAFGLFKRSIADDTQLIGADIDSQFSEAHRHLEKLQELQEIASVESNSISLLNAAAKLDPQGCARRYVCSLAASPEKSYTTIEKALLDLIESQKDAGQFLDALRLGRQLGSPKECAIRFPRCTYSITEMLRLVQPVY